MTEPGIPLIPICLVCDQPVTEPGLNSRGEVCPCNCHKPNRVHPRPNLNPFDELGDLAEGDKILETALANAEDPEDRLEQLWQLGMEQ